MTNALYTARTGLDAQDIRMRVIANNLANVNTTGFKRDRAEFETLLYQTITPPGAATSDQTQAPTGLTIGTGVRTSGTARLHTQGNIVDTGNALDLAIDGGGFFAISMPDGRTAYSRAGSFQRSAEGDIVTAEGYKLQPQITIPAGAQSISIGADGTVSYVGQGDTQSTVAGQILLSDFSNPAGLQPIGQNLYLETDASGNAIEGAPQSDSRGRLLQGNLEASNVNVVQELVDMIETQRAYEVNSKVISAVDGMLQYANQTL